MKVSVDAGRVNEDGFEGNLQLDSAKRFSFDFSFFFFPFLFLFSFSFFFMKEYLNSDEFKLGFRKFWGKF